MARNQHICTFVSFAVVISMSCMGTAMYFRYLVFRSILSFPLNDLISFRPKVILGNVSPNESNIQYVSPFLVTVTT